MSEIARAEHTVSFPADRGFVRRQADHTVRHDHIDALVRHGQALDLAEPELDVPQVSLCYVPAACDTINSYGAQTFKEPTT